jgi:hypothetical protein
MVANMALGDWASRAIRSMKGAAPRGVAGECGTSYLARAPRIRVGVRMHEKLEYKGKGKVMPSSVLRKASDLPPDIRQAVGRLLGRQLEPEEHISVMAYEPHAAPTGAARSELAARLKGRIDKTAAKLKDVAESEIDDLIDEAVNHVRHHRPRQGRRPSLDYQGAERAICMYRENSCLRLAFHETERTSRWRKRPRACA